MTPEQTAFELAGYYDVDPHAEVLIRETPVEALTWFFSGRVEPGRRAGGSAEEIIRTMCPVIVHAFARDGHASNFGELVAENIVEQIEEQWLDDYGGEDSPFSQEQLDGLAAKLAPHIQEFSESEPVWRHTKCAEQLYDAERAIELMRAENPDWFEPLPAEELSHG